MTYPQQGQAFLNAYWSEHGSAAEDVWNWANKFAELDIEKKKTGSDLDEFNAHRFLEGIGSTKRVVELRDELRAIDLDFNKRMALVEFLLFNFKCKVEEFVERPQGDNSKEIEKATQMLAEVQQLLDAAMAAAALAKKAAEQAARTAAIAKKEADEAKAKADDAKAKADAAKAAEDEQRSALAEVQAQEAAREAKTNELTAKGEDMNLGAVARNKAKNELAQHLSEDPLPLRKAKITLEAATRKAEKARVAADASHAVAEEASQKALAAKRQADKDHADAVAASHASDAAVAEAEAKVAEAEAYLEEQKKAAGNAGQGAFWWLERELQEKKKYLPRRLQ